MPRRRVPLPTDWSEALEINSDQPITGGRLAFYAPLRHGRTVDVVNGGRATKTGLNTSVNGANGPYFSFAASNYADFGAPPLLLGTTTPAVILGSYEARSTSGASTLVEFRIPGSAETFIVYIGTGASYYWTCGIRGASSIYGANFSTEAGIVTNNVRRRFAVVGLSGFGAQQLPAQYVLWLDGRKYTTTLATAYSGSGPAAAGFRIGARLDSGGADPWEGPLGDIGIIIGVPPDAVLAELTSNDFDDLILGRTLRAPVNVGGTDATASGVTITSTASLVPGSASGQSNATAGGATLTAAASLVAGSAQGEVNATATGQTLTATASLLDGSATGQVNATAGGATVTASSSILAGAATGQENATAAGQTLTATASLLEGSAAGQVNADAAGQTLTATASLIPGNASAANAGTAGGVTLTASASLIEGAATGQVNATAGGALLTAGVSLVAGAASAANDASASGVVIEAAALFIAGSASGNADSTASGATVTATVTLISGGAYGPTLASTPGFRATRAAPMFTARIGPDGRSLPRRRAS